MRPSLILSDLYWVAPDAHYAIDPISLQLAPCRTGLVGRNGCGKSTLLSMAGGQLQPTGGQVMCDGRVALLRQDVHDLDTVADLFGIADSLRVLARAAAGTATLAELADADWELPARVMQCLQRFSLDVEFDQPLASLSGGQKTRARLAALIFEEPDFILLDEPTNHLDREGRDQLLNLLRSWKGGALVASHDRELLDVMDCIVELSSLGVRRYGGNGTFYQREKAAELSQAEAALQFASRRSADLAAHRQRLAERQSHKDKSGRHRRQDSGQSKMVLDAMAGRSQETAAKNRRVSAKRLEDAAEQLQAAKSQIETRKPLSVSLPPTGLARGQCVLRLARLCGGYSGQPAIIREGNLRISGPERIAVQGGNGAGKSTLLSLIAGKLTPRSGELQVVADHVLLDQEWGLLDKSCNVLENFQRLNPGVDTTQSRTLLSRLQFRDEQVLQPVHSLSGGQQMRVALACTVGNDRPARFMMLDEPTNHLDLEAQGALEAALRTYDGALLVVSHDVRFLDAIGIDRRVVLV